MSLLRRTGPARVLKRYARGEGDFDGVTLPSAAFAQANLESAQFKGADLHGADLRLANLRGADLRMANLQDANLEGADLTGSLMVRTDLYRANLRDATLMPRWLDDSFIVGADLSSAVIHASFEDVVVGLGTKFHNTTLVFADLSKVQYASQLESLRDSARQHGRDPSVVGRSDVDLATLNNTVKMLRADLGEANRFKSDPQDLLAFFRESGMDEDLLEVFFLQPLASPERHSSDLKYDVFLPFKNTDPSGNPTPDASMAKELHRFLSDHNLRVFMSNATLEELGTAQFKEAIDAALDAAPILVVVASSPDHVKAPWVSYEWNSFFTDIFSNLKPNAQVFTYLEGISPAELPRSLRGVQSFFHGEEGLRQLCRFLTNWRSRHESDSP